MGRVTSHSQTTDGQTYPTSYNYDPAGNLLGQTYPSGRVVSNTLDPTGDLSEVMSQKTANGPWVSYADSFTFNAAGAVTDMKLGNGLWESTEFNSRLQPEMIALGSSQGAADKLKIDYTYTGNGQSGNNGNVTSQTITVPGLATPFIQNYEYDALNRLKSATETNNGSQTWTQVLWYDLLLHTCHIHHSVLPSLTWLYEDGQNFASRHRGGCPMRSARRSIRMARSHLT